MKRLMTFTVSAMIILLWSDGQMTADVIFDTTPSWDGSTSVQPWGVPSANSTATYGQTFLAPTSASVLENYTFYITGMGTGGSITYQADVYAWSGSLYGGNSPQGATGQPLFTSSNMTFTDNGSFQAVTINTGGTVLTPGGAYIALLTTSDPTSVATNAANASYGAFYFGDTQYLHVADDGGGGFNFYNNRNSTQLNSYNWDDTSDFGDLAWKADFVSAVPEPSGFALVGLSVVCLAIGYVVRKRIPGMSREKRDQVK